MKLIWFFCAYRITDAILFRINTPCNFLDSLIWLPNKHNTGLGGRIGLWFMHRASSFELKAREAAKSFLQEKPFLQEI